MPKPTHAFKPRIELSMAEPSHEHPRGALEAVLRLGASDFIVLERHSIVPPACEHVAREPAPENLKAVDRMMQRYRAVARQLRIDFNYEKDAVVDLIWHGIDTF